MAQDSILPQDEQFPLLKPDGGGDAKKHVQNPSAVINSGWTVTCSPKKNLCSRWPHLLSVCWMSVVLLVISFLVFYALGLKIGIYGRQPVVILRCNDSIPAGNVYYHHIVPNENTLHFKTFSDYISHMATLYPSLRFHVHFLMDDSAQNSLVLPKSLRIFKRLIPRVSTSSHLMVDQKNLRIIQEFQRKYQNVNVSVFCLSKYMAATPLKFKWRRIPQNTLPFYARIYEVWRNGGIGLDLVTHNYRFNVLKKIDHRIDAILKQHNDGINLNKYAETLENFESQENNELITMVLDFFNVFNQGGSNLNTDFSTDIKLLDKPETRTHRRSRHINEIATKDYYSVDIKTVEGALNASQTASNSTPQTNFTNTQTRNETLSTNNTDITNITQNVEKDSNNTSNLKNNSVNVKNNGMRSYLPQFYHVYDFSGFIGDSPVPLFKSDFGIHDISRINVKNTKPNFVTLNSDGAFVAGTSPNHPFLMKLISSGCSNISPLIAIQDTYRKHCSNFIFNDLYCDSVRILYNL